MVTKKTVERRITYDDSVVVTGSDENGSFRLTRGSRSNACYQQATRNLVSEPQWKTLISTGKDATNAYRRFEAKQLPTRHVVTEKSTPTGYAYRRTATATFALGRDYTSSPFYVLSNAHDATLQDIAVKRLKDKVGARTKQVQLLIPLAESRELRGLVRSLVVAGVDLVKALAEIKRSKGKSAYQFASHAWLTWSFGLAPTISEITAVSEAIDSYLHSPDGQRYTERGAAKKTFRSTVKGYAAVKDGTAPITYDLVHTLSYRIVSGFRVRIDSGNNYGADVFGLSGMGNLVPALWELTAFSWVFDYYSTIGDYLEDTFVVQPIDTAYCVLTRKYVLEGFVDMGPSVGPWITASSALGGRQQAFRLVDVQRSPLSKIPQRSLRFKTSDEIGKNALNKLLNLSAVLLGGKSISKTVAFL